MVYCGLFSVPMKCFKEKYFDNFSVNIVLSIYNFGYLKYDLTEEELKETFVASNGWWHRFSKRYDLASENLLGEAGSADHKVPFIYYVSTSIAQHIILTKYSCCSLKVLAHKEICSRIL